MVLRAVTTPQTGKDRERQYVARTLLVRVGAGEITATISEVVIHEIAFNLTSPRQYGLSVSDAIGILYDFLELPDLWVSEFDRARYVRALELWESHPKLEFSDAVIAARCKQDDLELVSFDRHFDQLDHLRRWQPSVPDSST